MYGIIRKDKKWIKIIISLQKIKMEIFLLMENLKYVIFLQNVVE